MQLPEQESGRFPAHVHDPVLFALACKHDKIVATAATLVFPIMAGGVASNGIAIALNFSICTKTAFTRPVARCRQPGQPPNRQGVAMPPQSSQQNRDVAQRLCPASLARTSSSIDEQLDDRKVATILAMMLIIVGGMGLALLQAQAAPWPALVAAFGILLAAQAVLYRLWHRLKKHLLERDEALSELCRTRRQAAQAAAERARMMAFITHELRTPLNGMLGMAELLRGTELTPEQVNYLQAIDNSGRLLLSMVNELLETARAEATGAMDIQTQAAKLPFDPARMVEETCELLSPRAHARSLALACFVHPAVQGQWLGDEARLRQVLLNLLGNALKFTQHGGVIVRLEPEENGLVLSVADTGPGVPPGMEQRIFAPFAREAAADAAREGGVGLGLAIVRQLLELMGGRLRLENRPGEGATFHVHLPMKQIEAGEPERQSPLAGARVMLAVEEAQHRDALHDYIVALGGQAECITAQDLPGALAREACDVIVDAAHADALRAWLRAAGGQRPARIWLLLTPEQRLALHDLLQHEAIDGWLLKPVRRQTLIERLAHAPVERMANASVRALRAMAHAARQAPADAAETATKQPLVLLAEDDPVNAQVAQVLLQRLGYRVRHFADGAGLLEAVRGMLLAGGERPLCVLLDIHMPGMDGLEAAQAIRQIERELGMQGLPLIALSAADEETERARIMAAGMDGFLPKPLDPEQLRESLRALQGSRTLAEARPPASMPLH